MRDTWNGSGINQIEKELDFDCRCGWEGKVEAVSNDWRTMFFTICPSCDTELEQEA